MGAQGSAWNLRPDGFPRFDPVLAHEALALSFSTYPAAGDEERCFATWRSYGYGDLVYLASCRAAIGVRREPSGRTLVAIGFRGTFDAEDLLLDLDLLDASHPETHRGFLRRCETAECEAEALRLPSLGGHTLAALMRDGEGDASLSFLAVGHSLGGAAAALFTARALGRIPDGRRLACTFGCPTYASKEEVERRNPQPILNLVNEHDFVAVAPQKVLPTERRYAWGRYGRDLRGRVSESRMAWIHLIREHDGGVYSQLIDRLSREGAV